MYIYIYDYDIYIYVSHNHIVLISYYGCSYYFVIT